MNVGLAGNIGQSLAYQVAEYNYDYCLLYTSSLAMRTLGDMFPDIEQGAKNGLELSYDSILKGRNGITPVSYTHLDVYKRQPLERPVSLSIIILTETTSPYSANNSPSSASLIL